jgi:hypothetical protein
MFYSGVRSLLVNYNAPIVRINASKAVSVQHVLWYILCMSYTKPTLVTLLFLALFASSATAQQDLLKGPQIDPEKNRSITHHTMTGKLEIIDGRPEMAAFSAVAQDSGLIEKSIEIELERTVRLSMSLIDELDLLREATDAMLDGDKETAQEIYGKIYDVFDPEKLHDPLSEDLMNLLDEKQRASYRRVLEEYWDAWIDAVLRDRMDSQSEKVRTRARTRLTRQLFMSEMKSAYDISLKRYQQAMDAIYSAVEPTDEQRAQIREMVLTHIKSTRLEATIDQRRGVMIDIFRMLDEERQEKLYGYILQIALPDQG